MKKYNKCIYEGLGHKLAFKKWSLIKHYKNGDALIIPIIKKHYNQLVSYGLPEEV